MVISEEEPDQEEEEEGQVEEEDDEVEDHPDDTDSVASDFEVIPVPECFDMSRPLDSSTYQGKFLEQKRNKG